MSAIGGIRRRELGYAAVLALLVKGAITLWLASPLHTGWGHLGRGKGDTPSYIDPIESLIAGHGYDPDFRMPGYGAVYLGLRSLFTAPVALDALIVLNWLADSFTVLLVLLLTWRLTSSRRAAWFAYLIYLLSYFASWADDRLLTEAMATPALLLTFYLILDPVNTGRRRLLLAGGFYTWLVFMKPVYIIVLPIHLLWLWWRGGLSWRPRLRVVAFFIVPFLLIDGLWCVRNAIVHRSFVPLTRGVYYPYIAEGPLGPVYSFVQAFGGQSGWWYPDSESRYFHVSPVLVGVHDMELPAWLPTSQYTMDSLRSVADDMERYMADTASTPARTALGLSVRERMQRYRISFTEEHPWRYHVFSRLSLARRLLLHSGSPGMFQQPFPELNITRKFVKSFSVATYLFVVVAGICAALFALLSRSVASPLRIMAVHILICIFIFPFVFRFCEYRYLLPMYPWLTVMTAWCVFSRAWSRIARARRSSDAAEVPDA